MRIAFYAPLKPLDWPVPSGDRLIARMFKKALDLGGHDVRIASRLRSYDRNGDAQRQIRIRAIGRDQAIRLTERYRRQPKQQRPELWFTYHLYHKAPDWIGPHVANALGIPYVVAEASFAHKQTEGPWAEGHEAVRQALGQAALVLGLNKSDREGITPYLPAPCVYHYLPVFIDCGHFIRASKKRAVLQKNARQELGLPPERPIFLTAAMMRDGNKLRSFQVLAAALKQLRDDDWHLLIAGAGDAERAVREDFSELSDRVSWLGLLPADQLAETYAAADLFLWPAVNEPIGMTFIEAQATATPVIGGRTRGVPDVICDGKTGLLVEEGNADAFALAVRAILNHPKNLRAFGQAARENALSRHDIHGAAPRLSAILEALVR